MKAPVKKPRSEMALSTFAVAQTVAEPRDVEQNVTRHVRQASVAAEHGASLVVFPELSLTGYDLGLTRSDSLDASDSRLQPLRALADRHDMVIVAGAPVASKVGLHIGALSFLPSGDVQVYLKVHVHDSEKPPFVDGPGGPALRLGADVVGLAICADLTHCEHVQHAVRGGATVYAAGCFLTASGYPRDALMLAGYARHHGIAVLMANFGASTRAYASAGKSAIWADNGELLACAPDAGEAVVLARRSEDGWQGEVLTGG